MDLRGLFDQVLQSGKELAQQGKDYVVEKVNLPEEGPERDEALSTMGKAAAAGGALALLLGTRGGRRVGKAALKLGSLAALGGLAYKVYKDYSAKQSGAPMDVGASIEHLEGPAANLRVENLLRAMVAAARADGMIDPQERERLERQMQAMGVADGLSQTIRRILDESTDPESIARLAGSPAEAAELYLASLVVMDNDSPLEQTYLDRLAKALRLPSEVTNQLTAQAMS
jgi:uncharacterized membrane protein YebE (DUF533 family)